MVTSGFCLTLGGNKSFGLYSINGVSLSKMVQQNKTLIAGDRGPKGVLLVKLPCVPKTCACDVGFEEC